MDEHIRSVDKAVGGAAEEFVEQPKAPAEKAGLPFFVLGLEQQGCERGRKGQRVEGRDQHRDRDGDGKLLIHAPGYAGDERRRDEHCGEDEGDGDHRTAHFFHGLDGRGSGIHAFVDVMLHRLDHDDGVIDHQADGKHQAEERKRIDGETQRRER